MKTITTNAGSLILTRPNGKISTIPKGQQRISTSGDIVVVRDAMSNNQWTLKFDEVTVNGLNYESVESLVEVLSSFSRGGGAPVEGGVQSVTGDGVGGTSDHVVISFPTPQDIGAVTTEQLEEKSPELGLNEFLVNRGVGNVSGKILSSDLNLTADQQLLAYVGGVLAGRRYTGNSEVNTIPFRGGNGTFNVTEGTQSNNPIVLSQLNTALELKVDKIEGYGLSPEPFTSAEKDKLSTVEDPKFQGQFGSVIELEANGTGGEGNYAYVDGGGSVELYIWNNTNSTWDLVAGESTAETPASVLQKYEANADRNPFTDSRRDKLDSITAIFTSTLKTAYDQAVSWITTNGQLLIDHLTNTSNPHNVTAEQIGLGDIDNRLDGKADLVGGKIPQEQLPEVSGNSGLITEVIAASTTQYIIADIPADAPELLRFELYIPDTISPSFISMRFNGLNSGVYKHVLQNVNNTSYSISRNYSQNQLRVLASSSGAVNGRYNIRIEGTITNVAGQIKITNGTGYLSGILPSDAPDINNFFGSAHDQELTDGKITQLLFVAMNSGGTARIAAGSKLKIYGIS